MYSTTIIFLQNPSENWVITIFVDKNLVPKYRGTPPYDHPVYKTTSLLQPYSFKPNVKTIESFYYFEDPVNATTSLLRPGFYGPTVVALTGFHCINTLVEKTEKMVFFLWKHKAAIEWNSTTKCEHPSKQEVCLSIQRGNNQLSQASKTILVADRSAGHKVHWYSRL